PARVVTASSPWYTHGSTRLVGAETMVRSGPFGRRLPVSSCPYPTDFLPRIGRRNGVDLHHLVQSAARRLFILYKAQEHIHRSVAGLALLAIPTSRRRVAAFDLNWGVFFGICSPSRVGFPLYTPL